MIVIAFFSEGKKHDFLTTKLLLKCSFRPVKYTGDQYIRHSEYQFDNITVLVRRKESDPESQIVTVASGSSSETLRFFSENYI
jgi:hypothetical protein